MKKYFFLLILSVFTSRTNAQDKHYVEEEVSYWNTKDSVKIGGTLTTPKFKTQYPTVLLITGSGQQDKDETILIHKPFKIIAEYLTSRGIAVLRVDDRGKGATTGRFSKSTGENFVKDILAGVDFLSTRKEIINIGLLGHSEGGGLASEVSVKSKKVAFIVSMAGIGTDGLSVMVKQNFEILREMKFDTNHINTYLNRLYRPMVEGILAETDTTRMFEKTMQLITDFRKTVDEKISKNFLPTSSPANDTFYAKQMIKQMNNDWYRHFFGSNPAVYWQQTKCPVLALNGTKDIQVDAEMNLRAIEESLKKAKNKHYKIFRLKNHNHLFQETTTGSINEYAQKTDTPTKETLQVIGDWIVEITR
jgi:uncharacterized protein